MLSWILTIFTFVNRGQIEKKLWLRLASFLTFPVLSCIKHPIENRNINYLKSERPDYYYVFYHFILILIQYNLSKSSPRTCVR